MADTSKILDDKRSDVDNHYSAGPVVFGLVHVLVVGLVVGFVLVQGLVRVQLQDVAELLQQG